MLRELAVRADALGAVKTVFLGGGTPTILPSRLVTDIMRAITDMCSVDADAEITVEANPATVDLAKCEALRAAGINRMSIGVQSFHDHELGTLGRAHQWNDVVATFAAARKAGFSNLSLDLMYGIPGQTLASWRMSLKHILELAPSHLSAYELTPEADTPLCSLLQAGVLSLPSEDAVAEMFYYAESMLGGKAFEHYEISNYAQPGCRCRHNMAYWQRRPYIGLGVAAHSFNGHQRCANREDVIGYIESIEQGISPVAETTALTIHEAVQEIIFLGLRTIDGVQKDLLRESTWEAIKKALQSEALQGLAEITSDAVRLTSRGWLVSNQVIASILSGIEKHRRG